MAKSEDVFYDYPLNSDTSVTSAPNTNDSRSIFSENLRFYMKREGKSQREVAKTLGVSITTFNDWMTGRNYPRIEKIELLAHYFGVSVPDLVGEQRSTSKSTEQKNIGKDEVLGIILRLHTDAKFLEIVEKMSMLDKDKLYALQQFLEAFSK